MPSINSSRAPLMYLAVSMPHATGTSTSSLPWITRLGAVIFFRVSTRSPLVTALLATLTVCTVYAENHTKAGKLLQQPAMKNPTLVVVTDEPTSLTDSYAFIKLTLQRFADRDLVGMQDAG